MHIKLPRWEGLPVRLHARVLHGHVVIDGHDDSVVEHGVVHGVLVHDCRQVSASRWRGTSCTSACSCPSWSRSSWWAWRLRGGAWRSSWRPGSGWPSGVHLARKFGPANRSYVRDILTLVGVWTALTRASCACELFSWSKSTVSNAYLDWDPSLAAEDVVSLVLGVRTRTKVPSLLRRRFSLKYCILNAESFKPVWWGRTGTFCNTLHFQKEHLFLSEHLIFCCNLVALILIFFVSWSKITFFKSRNFSWTI